MLKRNTIFCGPSPQKLKLKLNTALRYARSTCVLGSGNKFADIKKTNGWVLFQRVRYSHPGYYYKNFPHELSLEEILSNQSYDSQKKVLKIENTQWLYHNSNFTKRASPSVQLTCLDDAVNPLDDSQFRLSTELKLFLTRAIYTQQIKQGNCGFLSHLIAKYLWENPVGIRRIEIMSSVNFDHVFVVVNRIGDINKSETWNAWVIEPWCNEGMVYPSEEFKQRITETKKFLMKQMKKSKDILDYSDTCLIETGDDACIQDVEIRPQRDRYPTYGTAPFIPVENYYKLANVYPCNLLTEKKYPYAIEIAEFKHKHRYAETLSKISAKDYTLQPPKPR